MARHDAYESVLARRGPDVVPGAPGTTSPRVLDRAVRSVLASRLARWSVGRLTVHLPDGTVLAAGRPDAEPNTTLRVADERFFREFALRGDIGAGESYMNGDWTADDLPGFLELAMANGAALSMDNPLTRLLNVPNLLRHRLRGNTRRGSRRNIRAHYDLSNELFALFLDPGMTYSSAVFAGAGDTLERAQQRKFERIGESLCLGPGDHVLEIGCGWGGFALFAARHYGCRVTGITLSREQFDLATRRVRDAGLADRIDLRVCDYRDVRGAFSKIVSIEMLEAVGREHWPAFFEACDRALAPGGEVGIQTISMPDHRFAEYARRSDWIQRYIFPGGLLPSVGELCAAMGRRTALGVRRLDDIAPHYAETLARWRHAFFARLPEVRALGFDERFVRMWDFYLASCEALFRSRRLGTLQLVLGRSGEVPHLTA
jgi:cyclopropane-fatty-acyl-phospholipid synthase